MSASKRLRDSFDVYRIISAFGTSGLWTSRHNPWACLLGELAAYGQVAYHLWSVQTCCPNPARALQRTADDCEARKSRHQGSHPDNRPRIAGVELHYVIR